jgi:mRNA interferase MazF
MKLSAGDVLLARFPFTDLTSDKRRPVLVLSVENNSDDVIVCAITSRPRSGPYDIPIAPQDGTGLKVQSCVQFDKIATLAQTVISGRIGRLPASFMRQHKPLLVSLFGLGASL